MEINCDKLFRKQIEKIARNDPSQRYFSNLRIWTDSVELPTLPVLMDTKTEFSYKYNPIKEIESLPEKDFKNFIKGIENSSHLVHLELHMGYIEPQTNLLLEALSKNKSIKRLCLDFGYRDRLNSRNDYPKKNLLLKSLSKNSSLESLHINFPRYIYNLEVPNRRITSKNIKIFSKYVKKILLDGFISLKNFYLFVNIHANPLKRNPSNFGCIMGGNHNLVFRGEDHKFYETIYNRNLTLKIELEELEENLSIIKNNYQIPQEIIDIIHNYSYRDLLQIDELSKMYNSQS